MKRKKCSYYCDGYCFWYNDEIAIVCDTGNNRYKGYCPMVENNKELKEWGEALIEEERKKLEEEKKRR